MINNFFEYIYYRVLIFYVRKKDSTAQLTASIVVSIVQFFFILDIAIIIRVFYEFPIPEGFNKYWGLLLAIPLGLFNWLKYVRNQVSPSVKMDYLNRWKREDENLRRRRGVGIISLIILLIFIPIFFAGILSK